MKKIIATLLLLVLCLTCALTVACGGDCEHEWNEEGVCIKCGQENSDQGLEPVVKGEDVSSQLSQPVTVKFYHTMGEDLRSVLDRYIPEFQELYPNITIEHNAVGGYDDVRDQIKTEINTNAQPNLAYCYPDHVANYNVSGAVATLDSYIYSNNYVKDSQGNEHIIGLSKEEIADFIPGYWDEGKQFGSSRMYTLPLSKSTEVLFYNKTYFDANQIPVPTHWWCSAEICGNCNQSSMAAVCEKIKGLDSTSTPLGYDSEANWFITMCEQLGSPYTAARGENYRFDHPTNRAFVKTFADWYSKGWLTTKALNGSYTSSLFVQTAADQNKSYMSIGSSAGATNQCPDKVTDTNGKSDYPFEVGIASIPQANPSNPKVISQGPSICMFAKDNKAEELATWLFMKYITTNVDFQVEFALASGYIPVLQSLTDNSKADYVKGADGEYVLDEDGQKIPNTYMAFQARLANANGGDNIAALALKVALAQADAYYTSPAFNGSSTARDQVGALLQKCLVMDLKDPNIDSLIKAAFEKAIKECISAN